MARKVVVVVPDTVAERIRRVCEEYNVTPQDLLLRAIVKVLEEFEVGGR